MSFTSFIFLAYVIFVVILYYSVPKRFQWVMLLMSSYAFYLYSGIKQVFFIMATTLITFFAGRIMQNIRDKNKAQLKALPPDTPKEEKRALKARLNTKVKRVQYISVLMDLGILFVVKYLKFITVNIDNLFSLFKWDVSIPLVNVIVPLGISFYTFQSMGYLIDVGRGKYEAEKHIGKFAAFVSFFPCIVQGPINRYDDLGKQLNEPHKLDYNNIKFGAQLILWGFFKKLVIADRAAPLVKTVFSADYAQYSGSQFFVALLAYAVQIYGDFSGGIDIARGVAQMLGINLPQNFERPYFSTSVADFWRRWHITLGNWMRDYVFYTIMLSKPITKLSKGARKRFGAYAGKMVPSVITPFIVFTLIGVWHGASWQYVCFGLYNATVVASSVALTPVFKKIIEKLKINTEAFSWKFFQIVRTFFVLGISKLLVKAPGLKAAVYIIKKIFTDVNPNFLVGVNGKIFELGIDRKNMLVLFISLLILLTVSVLQENGMKIRETIAKQNLVFRWGLFIILLLIVLVFGIYGPGYSATDFIYQAY